MAHWIGGSRSSTKLKLHRTAEKIRERTPRLQWDRTPIAARSSRDCGSFLVESPPRSIDGVHCWIEITIVARSWGDRGSFEAKFWAHSMPIWKPRCRQGGSLPRPMKSAPTAASIAHDLRANFSFKMRCILPLKSNF